jgi:PAS domain S-box-containing protein
MKAGALKGSHFLFPGSLILAAVFLLLFARAEAAVVGLLAVAFAIAVIAWRSAEGRLEAERERSRNAREQAWQNALLGQVAEELRAVRAEENFWVAATTALGRALGASRVAIYENDGHGAYRLSAQFVAEGVPPLGDGAALPASLVTDRELAARVASSDLASEEDPEVRALAGLLRARSLMVVPVERENGERAALVVHECESHRQWSEGEKRFVQRFAEHVGKALEHRSGSGKLFYQAELRAGLLRFAQALAAARDPRTVAEIAVSVGAPLSRAHRGALFAEDEEGGFEVAAEWGFDGALDPAFVSALRPRLDEAVRGRAPVRMRAAEANRRAGALELVPMFYGREPMGVLLLEGSPDGSGCDLEAAHVIAELAAAALKSARLLSSATSTEACLSSLCEAGGDVCLTVEEGGKIREANSAACGLLGFSKAELESLRLPGLLAGESASRWKDLEEELFRDAWLGESRLTLRSKEGSLREVSVRGGTIGSPAEAPAPRKALLLMRDQTEIRRLEQQLRQSQKLGVVGALASGVAHDFNNVLGGILGYASLVRTYLADRPVAARYVETIERSAIRGAELAGRLLSATRPMPERHEPVNLNQVVEETLELLAHSFHKSIRIDKRLDPKVRSMMADASQLQQIVLNLCVNARDAMPEGGVLHVATRLLSPEARVQLTVEDDGVGMDSKTLARLFEPFFSTKGEAGTGLGLSVVYGIVKSLGGDVGVKSTPGRGARFDVVLPCRWVEESKGFRDTYEPAPGQGELILLVDDEKVLRELGRDILETHGYRVATAGSGEEALGFLEDSGETVSLVILDVVMPGLGGNETFRRLRGRDRALPVLLSSGLTGEESVRDLLRDGACGFIPKPYRISDLTRAVSTALRRGNPSLVH